MKIVTGVKREREKGREGVGVGLVVKERWVERKGLARWSRVFRGAERKWVEPSRWGWGGRDCKTETLLAPSRES